MYGFDIHDVEAETYNIFRNQGLHSNYSEWKIEANVISFYKEGYNWRDYRIEKAPTLTDKTMVLGVTFSNGKIGLYYLSKR